MEFRKDINGLRAWAVALVVLYHFGVPGFAGGFIGVDVFFVISGFLMTVIILGKQKADAFSLTGFYLSRARRIVPAIAFLCIILLLFGWFWLSALDYRVLSYHALSAVAFFSNFVLRSEAGYFDVGSDEKWLLHTWSLSLEWQFYLIYPLLLILIRRAHAGGVSTTLWGVSILSLFLSVTLSAIQPATAFFLLPTRAWELIAGGLVYIHGERVAAGPIRKKFLEVTGLSLILLAGTVLADQQEWPGGMAIVPVLGAILVMLAARQDSPLTALPAVQAVGRWSYSVYLWHWPILVGAKYFGLNLSIPGKSALIFAALAIGWVSYRLVEEPVRHTKMGRGIRWKGILAMTLPVIVLGGFIYEARGLPQRLPAATSLVELEAMNKKKILPKCGGDPDGNKTSPECHFGAKNKVPTVAVWGDSHALAAMRAIGSAAEKQGRGAILYNKNDCPPVLGAIRHDANSKRDCKDFNEETLSQILGDARIDTVIFMARWSVYLEGYTESSRSHSLVWFREAPDADIRTRRRLYADHLIDTLCKVAAKKKVAVVAPMPEFSEDVPRAMVRSLIVHGKSTAPQVTRRAYQTRHGTVLQALGKARDDCNVEILDPLPLLCDSRLCYGANQGKPIYFDDDHLGIYGNRLMTPLFDNFFSRLNPGKVAMAADSG